MINRIKHAIVVLFLLGNFSLASAAPPEVTRFTLSNDIRVVNLYVEDSTDVAIFSYLPLGLVADGKAKTQWSHLIEHLTIRTTGPIDFKTSSAETMADNMRLEFIGNTDNWTRGLKRHAKWLSGLPFSAESLAEELPNALSEIDVTEMRLATHKWAFAAWNQVFRHGETTISMRGDVQSAQLSELQEYRDLHLVQVDRVLLCVIGGINAETLLPVMETQLGSINLTAKTLPPATTLEAAKDQIATWDVKVTHYIETYAIPRPENENYPALYMASLLCRLACTQDAQLKELIGYIHCGVDLVTPEQAYLYVSASLKPGTDIEKVKQRIGELISQLKQPANNAQVPMYAQTLSMELGSPPDMKMLMQQYKAAGMTETMMLGNIGLQWGMLEYQYGDTLPQFASALANVSADDVADVVNRYLTEDKQMTLLLTPRALE